MTEAVMAGWHHQLNGHEFGGPTHVARLRIFCVHKSQILLSTWDFQGNFTIQVRERLTIPVVSLSDHSL